MMSITYGRVWNERVSPHLDGLMAVLRKELLEYRRHMRTNWALVARGAPGVLLPLVALVGTQPDREHLALITASLLCLIAILPHTAAAIVREQQHNTLEALLSTRLTNVEILLGKLCAPQCELIKHVAVPLLLIISTVLFFHANPLQVCYWTFVYLMAGLCLGTAGLFSSVLCSANLVQAIVVGSGIGLAGILLTLGYGQQLYFFECLLILFLLFRWVFGTPVSHRPAINSGKLLITVITMGASALLVLGVVRHWIIVQLLVHAAYFFLLAVMTLDWKRANAEILPMELHLHR